MNTATKMKTYRVKVKQVYVETMFIEAESEDDAIHHLQILLL